VDSYSALQPFVAYATKDCHRHMDIRSEESDDGHTLCVGGSASPIEDSPWRKTMAKPIAEDAS
jgi:hypothetical protein